MTDREAASDAVHEALPAGWAVGPPTYDPGISAWPVTARTVAASRNKPPVTVAAPAQTKLPPCEPWTIVSAACRSPTARAWPNANAGSGSPTSRVRGKRGAMRLRRGLTGEDLRARGRPEPEIGTTPDLGGQVGGRGDMRYGAAGRGRHLAGEDQPEKQDARHGTTSLLGVPTSTVSVAQSRHDGSRSRLGCRPRGVAGRLEVGPLHVRP